MRLNNLRNNSIHRSEPNTLKFNLETSAGGPVPLRGRLLMRITLLAIGIILSLLFACFPGLDRASDCKEWDTAEFWQTATLEKVADCLEAGADPNVRQGFEGWTSLHWAAAYSKNAAIVASLVAAGADPNVRENSVKDPAALGGRKKP